MPRDTKSAYTDKQKRKAQDIEKSYENRGISRQEAKSRAWATVNKQDGGGKQSGSGRKSAKKTPAKKKPPGKRKSLPKKAPGKKGPRKHATSIS